jgi:hypothetical protein
MATAYSKIKAEMRIDVVCSICLHVKTVGRAEKIVPGYTRPKRWRGGKKESGAARAGKGL